ncbi:hypothetical protein LAZ67_6003595 [Cordylochernes scorpioides]|uniref:Uncharacterized protein n=1 Tax=Cordylochernes scorpioides TaxID=51811 RepID=A0ABY6KKR0_9ARAC|nr:hypothetical protein LAZ67_6003595 [Cordylochernes scorpioides]
MKEAKPISTPMDSNSKLTKISSIEVSTRPDIAYAVSVLGQFSNDPRRQHWNAAKRVLRYLKGTLCLKITYEKTNETLYGCVEADWGGNLADRKSQTGLVFFLAGGPIAWESKKQQTVALSSTESEYIALCEAGKEAVYLRALLDEMGFGELLNEPTVLKTDNQGAQQLARNPVHHARTKHIDIKWHYIRSICSDGLIEVVHTPTQENVADILTKGLPRFFSKARQKITYTTISKLSSSLTKAWDPSLTINTSLIVPKGAVIPVLLPHVSQLCRITPRLHGRVDIEVRLASGNTGPRGPKISQTPPSEESTGLWTPRCPGEFGQDATSAFRGDRLSRDVELPRYDGSYEAQSFFYNYDAQADLAQLQYTERLRRLPNLLQDSLTDGLPVADQRIVAAVQPNTLQEWYSVVSRVRGTHSASQMCQQTTRTTPNPSFAPSPKYSAQRPCCPQLFLCQDNVPLPTTLYKFTSCKQHVSHGQVNTPVPFTDSSPPGTGCSHLVNSNTLIWPHSLDTSNLGHCPYNLHKVLHQFAPIFAVNKYDVPRLEIPPVKINTTSDKTCLCPLLSPCGNPITHPRPRLPSTFHVGLVGVTTEPVKVDRITEDSSMQRMSEDRDEYFADALTNMQPYCEDLESRLTDAIRGIAVLRAEEALISPFDGSYAASNFIQQLERTSEGPQDDATLQARLRALLKGIKIAPRLVSHNIIWKIWQKPTSQTGPKRHRATLPPRRPN